MELRIDSHRMSALPARLSRISAVMALLAILACGDGSTKPPIDPPNRAPVATGGIPGQTVAAGETTAVDVAQYFSDPDGDALTFAAESSDTGVATVSVSGSTVTVFGAGKGTATTTVTATDPDGLSALQPFTVTVPNRPPVVVDSIPGLELNAGDSATMDVSQHFEDPDGDALTFAAESSDTGVATVSVSGSTVTVFGAGKGTATTTVTATDADGLSAAQAFMVTVPNRPPVVVDSIPGLELNVGDSATMDVSQHFEDPDEDTLTFTVESSDTGVATVSVSGSTVTVFGAGKGTATTTVTATDADGLSAAQAFMVTVPNRPPVVVDSIPGLELDSGDSATVDVSRIFEDPDGDPLTFAVVSSDAQVATASSSDSLVTIRGLGSGTATVEVTAFDTEGLSSTVHTAVTVHNEPPEAVSSIPPLAIKEARSAAIGLQPYFRDPEGGVLTYSATTSDTALAMVLASDSTVTVTGVTEGMAAITVTATDLGGLSARQSFEVVVEMLTDRDVLVGLYEATGGPDWEHSDYWLTDQPLRLWWGVRTDGAGRGRVTELFLRANNLSGSIPSEIGKLQNLQYLYLDGNNLDGPIPPEIGKLQNLRRLELGGDWGGNNLDGPIPPEIGKLQNLRRLELAGNNLDGPIPPEIGELQSLQDLSLSDNNLDGPIPPEIGNLLNLQRLSLDRTNVDGPIPPQIGNLRNLERFSCGRCWSLNGPIPPEIGNLQKLQELWLNGTNLEGPIPSEIGNLQNLQYLELADNNLDGPIPSEIGNLQKLMWLGLSGTNLEGPIPPEIGNLQNLQTLNLRGNDLRGPIPPEIGNLRNLQKLSLSGYSLEGPIPSEIGNLQSLWSLYLYNTNVEGPIPPEIGNLQNLQYLYLRGNDLRGPIPPEMGNLRKLQDLTLSDNDLRGPIPSEIGNLVALQSLTMSRNNLEGPIPPEMGNLWNLQGLGLNNNTGLSGPLPGSLTTLGELSSFQAGGTDLCAPRDAAFRLWLQGIAVRRVATCQEEGSSATYLTQAVQSLRFPVPLVADEEALLRVFVTASDPGVALIPPVRATFFLDGEKVHVEEVTQQGGAIPTEIVEGDLRASANAVVPGALIQPSLEMIVEIDPDGTLDPSLGVTRRIPAEGRMAIEVRAMPPLDLTLIPFLWSQSPDSAILDTVQAMATDPVGHELFWGTRTLLPVRELSASAHEPVLTSTNDAQTLAENTRAVRAIEGSIGFYIGMMSGAVTGGTSGSAYSPYFSGGRYRSGFSVPRWDALAHTIGHLLHLRHAPCGRPFNPSILFPNPDGSIGAWGYDFREAGGLVPPTQPDLMSNCRPRWISEYHFTHAVRNRLLTEEASSAAAAPVKSLLLWGGVNADGEPYLEPAFVVRAPPTIEPSGGNYEIVGSTSSGDTLFALRFELGEQSGGETPGSSFAFLLPVRPEWAESLAALTLSGPGGAVTLDRDTDQPMTILRNSLTGQVRGILRDLPESALGRAGREPNLQVLFSRGIPDAAAWRR